MNSASSDITVVSSITGEKDESVENQTRGSAKWVMFAASPWVSNTWSIKKAYDRFRDSRRNSRIHKILIHQYADTKYSIWIDGNISLLVPPEELIEKYLANHDLAIFKHPNRDCIYDEAIVCAKRGLDNPETIIEQAKKYEDSFYAKHKGLCECGVIIRRHTKKVEEFNNAWWSEYCRHSVRDQISFMYAVDKVGLRINQIDEQFVIYKEDTGERYIRGGIVEIFPHKKFT